MANTAITCISIQDLVKDWALGHKQYRFPLAATIELTARCNMACRHCYINLHQDDSLAREKELNTEQWLRIIDELSDLGILFILLTGGEVFLRPDFFEIYTHAKYRGLLVSVFTNGTTITPGIVARLADLPPRGIEITLYGRTKSTHELVTGVPGSHELCMRGIDLLVTEGLPLSLKSTLSKLNVHELALMREYAGSLGLSFRFDPILNKRLDGTDQVSEIRLSPEEVLATDLVDPRRTELLQEIFRPRDNKTYDDSPLFTCGAGKNLLHVDPYGMLFPCVLCRWEGYNLRMGTLSEAWKEFIPRLRGIQKSSPGQCGQCELTSICRLCPGWAETETGDPELPVKYLCDIAHLRRQAYGDAGGSYESDSH